MMIVQTEKLEKVYDDKNSVPVKALRQVDLSIKAGEFTAIAGPSGSGKTTLLNLIGGLDQASSGDVKIDGKSLHDFDKNALADYRLQNVGFIFQSYNLIPVLTAEENVEFILLMQGVSDKERHERVKKELADLGIDEELMNRRPNELSGGQQQRVAVARAIIACPKLVLADEPTANLDSKTGKMLLDKMREMNEKRGITFLFSTHDQMVMEYAKRLIMLRDGEIVEDNYK